jgi:UDP-N-acetylmuramoyl-tripeptide--D-alanyl-D-alanine ligase
MEPTNLETIARWSGGVLIAGDPTAVVSTVCTDSRSLKAGDLFVALRGNKFDAHTFLPEAARLGAAAAIVEEVPADLPSTFGVIQVSNTLIALQRLSANYRRSLRLQVVGVTGSNGKTSTKDLTASVLGERLRVTKTEGNFNNHIGLPLTMLRAKAGDQVGVFEIGMNHPGEIAPLAALAAPNVAIITNVGIAHIEFLGTRDAIAQEKGMLAEALPPSGTVILSAEDEYSESIAARTKADAIFAGIEKGDVRASNLRPEATGTRFTLSADDAYALLWRQLAGARPVITFALDDAADVTADAAWTGDRWSITLHTPPGDATTTLAVAGRHNVKNALAAAACALAAECPLDAIARGIERFAPVKGRSQVKRLQRAGRDVTLVDDTYNANPDSVRAAIDVLAALPAPRWLVLGDMGEVGTYAAERGIEHLWTAGTLATHASAAFAGARHFVDVAALVAALDQSPPAASVVVKGSRFMKMEQVVAELMSAGGAHAS